MEFRLNQSISDRWCNIIAGLMAYIYLIVLILGYHSTTGQILVGVIGVLSLIFIIRVVVLLIRPSAKTSALKNNPDSVEERMSNEIKTRREGINFGIGLIGYMILLGVILGPEFDALWIIYGFIGLGVLSVIGGIIGNNRSRYVK